MELVQMSKVELQRHTVMQQIEGGNLGQADAAQQLGLSVRQVKRLWASYRRQGALGLKSKARGKRSNNAIACEVRAQIMGLVREHYADFGPTLASEYLANVHGSEVSRESLRGWMIAQGLRTAKSRRKRLHHSRQRRARVGELIQIDGSPHDWFEGRADKCTLMAFIDDATSRIMAARFFEAETTRAYLEMVQLHVQRYGRPLALYSHRHAIFTKHDPEDPELTQYGRAMLQLDIEPIHARSPQAKGRVERLFQTLQDRMVKCMRLQGINTIEQANAWLEGYIEQHNAQFAVAPADMQDAHRIWAGTDGELARICTIHHRRSLKRALNCQFQGDILQVHERQRHVPKGPAQVQIVQHLDGCLQMYWQGLAFTAFGRYEHLKVQSTQDDKTLNARVDQLCGKGANRPAPSKLQAQMQHQQAQRSKGIYHPTHHASELPQGFARS